MCALIAYVNGVAWLIRARRVPFFSSAMRSLFSFNDGEHLLRALLCIVVSVICKPVKLVMMFAESISQPMFVVGDFFQNL